MLIVSTAEISDAPIASSALNSVVPCRSRWTFKDSEKKVPRLFVDNVKAAGDGIIKDPVLCARWEPWASTYKIKGGGLPVANGPYKDSVTNSGKKKSR